MAEKKQAEFLQWFNPTLDALRELGGSGSPVDVSTTIAKNFNIPESKLNETIKSGASKFHNQVCWARQYLVWEGYIDPSVRGVWKLTKKGENKKITDSEARKIFLKWVEINAMNRKKKEEEKSAVIEIDEEEIDDSSLSSDYKKKVLEYLRAMSPKNFERFCLYLLRVNAFENLQLTGKSHDEGIDGIAILRINPVISFRVLFQAKRYKEGNNVSRVQIGDFRNAMIGRADKGIFITTSKFTSEAIKEAYRDGAPQVELVDSDKLINMMELSQIGLKQVTTYEVDPVFFQQYLKD